MFVSFSSSQNKSLLQFMGDPAGELTKALDMKMTHPGPQGKGLYGRCKRHAIYAVNGEIKAINIAEKEDDPAGDDFPEATLADTMLEVIAQVKQG
jgi:peroxiredoxin